MALAKLGINSLEDHNGKRLSDEAKLALNGKFIGLYFSASWCPPCVAFSPELDEFAGENKEDFIVILVSHDHNERDFLNYSSHKENFYRIPWSEYNLRNELPQKFGVYALPTLQIIHPNGESVTSWGRAAITRNKAGCLKSWKEGGSGASFLQLLGLIS